MNARRRLAAVALAALTACPSAARPAGPSLSPSPSPNASALASPSPSGPPAFDARRVVADVRVLTGIGVRLAASAGYDRAAAFTATRLGQLGYRVVRQRVPIPAGTSEGVPVGAGSGDNVIAYPPGYDPSAPHLVVGAHLDTVARTVGANDNGSGAAALLEMARLARLVKTRLPIVFVELIGEERRFRGGEGALFGSRFYFEHLSASERRSVRGMMNIDMVGNGPVVLVGRNSGTINRRFLDATLIAAQRLHILHREYVNSRFISDHLPFQRAGIPISWLWSGEHPTVHTPADTVAVLRPADIERIGRVGWEALRTFGG